METFRTKVKAITGELLRIEREIANTTTLTPEKTETKGVIFN